MSAINDLEIPISKLTVESDGVRVLASGDTDLRALIGVLTHTLQSAASEIVSPMTAELVSQSIDVTGSPQGGELRFSNRVDRQTRTLIFMTGETTDTGQSRLRATAIFRLSPTATE